MKRNGSRAKLYGKVPSYYEERWGKKVRKFPSLCFKFRTYTVTKANHSEVVLWKIAVLGMKKSVLVLEHFVPRPFLHAGNVRGRLSILYFMLSWKVTLAWGIVQEQYSSGHEFDPSLFTLFWINLRKIPEKMSSSMEKCKMSAWVRGTKCSPPLTVWTSAIRSGWRNPA